MEINIKNIGKKGIADIIESKSLMNLVNNLDEKMPLSHEKILLASVEENPLVFHNMKLRIPMDSFEPTTLQENKMKTKSKLHSEMDKTQI